MFEVKITHNGSYAEESQPNPIRWINLERKSGTQFVSTSNWWKCKDFLNDLVYTYRTGKSFGIYGWNADTIPLPKKGEPFWFAVKHLSADFFHNMENALNPWLKEQGMPEVQLVKQDPVLLALDPVYFKNTYNISLITLMVRLMNYVGIKFNNFDEVINCKKFPHGDQWKWEAVVKPGKYFKIPKKFEDYIWYCDATHNSESKSVQDYQIPQLVHNNGVVSWGENWK